MNSLHHVSLVAVRQQVACCIAQTVMEFEPQYEEQIAGFTYMYDAMNFYLLGKTVTEKGDCVLVLLKSDTGVVTDEIIPVPVKKGERVELKIVVDDGGMKVRFYYKTPQTEWTQAGSSYSTQILTDEHCRGFTGAHFGLYCHDMAGFGASADFDYMKVEVASENY